MITTQNIRGYINYLFLQRNGTSAPQDLLQKWSALQEGDIEMQLQKLYASWSLSEAAAKQYENEYLSAIKNSMPQNIPPIIAQEKVPQVQIAQPIIAQQQNKKSNAGWYALIIVLAIASMIGLTLWQVNNRNNTEPAASAAVEVIDSAAPAPTTIATVTQPTITDSAKEIAPAETEQNLTDADNQNISNILDLLDAEVQENFEDVYNYFSPSMEQYWEMPYPTRAELEEAYNTSWNKTSDRKYLSTNVNKIAENTYVLTGTVEYYSLKSQDTKFVKMNTLFVFDENGKIIIEKANK
jgi:hypothetical protein